MLGQTLIKKGHRQNHQMTAVRKNPLRINNPNNVPSILTRDTNIVTDTSPLQNTSHSILIGNSINFNNSNSNVIISSTTPQHGQQKKTSLNISTVDLDLTLRSSSSTFELIDGRKNNVKENLHGDIFAHEEETVWDDEVVTRKPPSQTSTLQQLQSSQNTNSNNTIRSSKQFSSSLINSSNITPSNSNSFSPKASLLTRKSSSTSFPAINGSSAMRQSITSVNKFTSLTPSIPTASPSAIKTPSPTSFEIIDTVPSVSRPASVCSNHSTDNHQKEDRPFFPSPLNTATDRFVSTNRENVKNHVQIYGNSEVSTQQELTNTTPLSIQPPSSSTSSRIPSKIKKTSSPLSVQEINMLTQFKVKKSSTKSPQPVLHPLHGKRPLKVPLTRPTESNSTTESENAVISSATTSPASPITTATTFLNNAEQTVSQSNQHIMITHQAGLVPRSVHHFSDGLPSSPQTPTDTGQSSTSVLSQPEKTKTPLIISKKTGSQLIEQDQPKGENNEPVTKEKLKEITLIDVYPNGFDTSNKKIKYQHSSDQELTYTDVVNEIKTLNSRVALLKREENGKKNSFKNLYNFQNNQPAMEEINRFEVEKMEKRIKHLKYYRKILKSGLSGWAEYKNERDSYVASRRNSFAEEGFPNVELSKEEEEVEIKRFDDEYRRFKQRLNPEISTKFSKAVEKVDPQSVASSLLENMLSHRSDKIKTEEDKAVEKEKLTAEITRWKQRWSPANTPKRSTQLSSSPKSFTEFNSSSDNSIFSDSEGDEDESETASESEKDDTEDDNDFEIVIINDLELQDEDGFFLTSTFSDTYNETMFNQVDSRKLLKAIVDASRKEIKTTLTKPSLMQSKQQVGVTPLILTPSISVPKKENDNYKVLPRLSPKHNSGTNFDFTTSSSLSSNVDEIFEMKVNVRESRVISANNFSRYRGKEIEENITVSDNQKFTSLEPPSQRELGLQRAPSPSELVRRSREVAISNESSRLKQSSFNLTEDDHLGSSAVMTCTDHVLNESSSLAESTEQNGTIDWKKEAGMMQQKRRTSVYETGKDEDDMVLMNDEEKTKRAEDEDEMMTKSLVALDDDLNSPQQTTMADSDKQKFQFNQLLQHLNSEVEYNEKTKKKKKKHKRHASKITDTVGTVESRPDTPTHTRQDQDIIEEDPNMTITSDQQQLFQLPPDGSKKLIIELDELLGIGAHGKVFKGFIPNYMTNTKDPVAIKKLSVKAGRFSKKFIKLEVDILKQLYHPYLVQYIGCKYNPKMKEYSIVLEYVDGGTLEQYVKNNGPLDEVTVSAIVSQVLMGLEYLHSKRIIHRDLKPGNILISSKGCVKITDFGVSAQLLNLEAIRTSTVGTPHYTAPEVISVQPYSFTADIWSLGCVMHELLFGKRPYNEFNQVAAMYHMVQDDKPPIPQPNNLSPICLDFINKCWTKDWKQRPGARELQSHPFINHSVPVIEKFLNLNNGRKSVILQATSNLTKDSQANE
ncbi:hypothetical protein FDP41_010735 [Naegleria fowleri]|uniref:Protein kinase domain-containing protein n=1 Tax=Naegleria fowleri TaxID=5763 RepID=A0A6A5C4T4_NAEFO|nr:uncharacterized protein FDP41_010735 [Naegleria fowleri]KAF0982756.1 hypothetical protein FDP41_010735 [Naegleria fowleri]